MAEPKNHINQNREELIIHERYNNGQYNAIENVHGLP